MCERRNYLDPSLCNVSCNQVIGLLSDELSHTCIVCVIVLFHLFTAGRVECVTLLLQEGAELDTPDVKAQTPLYVAVKNHHVDCVDLLLAAGACPDGHPATMACPLYLAAMDGFFHGVKVTY